MTNEERFSKIDEKLEILLVSNAVLQEQVKTVISNVAPMKKDILDQCQKEIKSYGWKSIAAIMTAVISGISGFAISMLNRFN